MALTDVTKEILDNARKRADAVIAAAEEDGKQTVNQAKQEVKDHENAVKEQTEALIAAMERKLLASARSDAQRIVSGARENALASVMGNAKDEIASLPDAQRKKFLHALQKQAESEIELDTIFVNKQDKDLVSGNVKTADIAGGLIAQTKDGSISVNLSVEEQLESVQAAKLIELSEVLFDE